MSKKSKEVSGQTKEALEEAMVSDIDQIVGETVIKSKQSEKDLNKFVYIVGIIGPILAAFQVGKIYFAKTAAGVSLTYWGAYLLMAGVWLTYGIYNKSFKLILVYTLWIVVELAVLYGIFIYG